LLIVITPSSKYIWSLYVPETLLILIEKTAVEEFPEEGYFS
jgi:predicted secreted protein